MYENLKTKFSSVSNLKCPYTYDMLSFDSLDEFRVLAVIDVRAERNVIDRYFPLNGDALLRHDFVGFAHDVLNAAEVNESDCSLTLTSFIVGWEEKKSIVS